MTLVIMLSVWTTLAVLALLAEQWQYAKHPEIWREQHDLDHDD